MKRHSIGKRGFPGGSEGRESTCNAGLIPGLGRSPGGGKGYSLQYLPRELHGQRSLAAPVHGAAESGTRLSRESGAVGRRVEQRMLLVSSDRLSFPPGDVRTRESPTDLWQRTYIGSAYKRRKVDLLLVNLGRLPLENSIWGRLTAIIYMALFGKTANSIFIAISDICNSLVLKSEMYLISENFNPP